MLYQTPNPHGGDIYTDDIELDFSASINPLGTPPGVLEAMKSALERSAVYPDPYCHRAVQAISGHEKHWNDPLCIRILTATGRYKPSAGMKKSPETAS